MNSQIGIFLSKLWNKGNTKDKAGGLVILGFFTAILLAIPSQVIIPSVGFQGTLGESPRFFPYVISCIGIILSIVAITRSFFRAAGPPDGGEGVLGKKQVRRAAPVILITIVYLLLFNVLGFIVAAILCLATLLWYYGLSYRTEWKAAAFVLIIFPSSVYLLFKYQLFVPLPAGLLKLLGLY